MPVAMADEHEWNARQGTVEVPAPTAWPMVLALGIALLFAGLVLNFLVSAIGAVFLLLGAFGWAFEVLPEEHHVRVPAAPAPEVQAPTRAVIPMEAGVRGHRAVLPVEIYPYMAGIRGGIAGGAVMAVLAALYGIFRYGSPWYPINILSASVMSSMASASTATLARFDLEIFLIAVLIHGTVSVLVGLLYGVLLPMLPRNPILFGGVIAPLLWTGLLWGTLDVINPVLDVRIDWLWFMVCQVGFGLTTGLITARSTRIPTAQYPSVAEHSERGPGGDR
jgi:Cytochrome c oxidase subunit IV